MPSETPNSPAGREQTGQDVAVSKLLESRKRTKQALTHQTPSGAAIPPNQQIDQINQRLEKLSELMEAVHEQPTSSDKEQFDQIHERLEKLSELVEAVHEQHTSSDKAFDIIYEELGDYKNDFFYERLKPMARQLLFLLDSIEEFDREVDEHAQSGVPLTSEVLKANLSHFRDQLMDSLQMTGMVPIEPVSDEFDPKTQRAVEVVTVPAANNNRVQRVVRGAWMMGKNILRPADVVVGRAQ